MASTRSQQRKRLFFRLSTLLWTFVALAGLFGSVLLVRVSQELYLRAQAQPANIQVDVSKVLGPMPRPWANLAQGGEDHGWRLEPLVGEVKTLRPEYIRIDHIFDFYDVVSGTPGNLQFNFSKLDLTLNDILATGAKPYIAISYMPPQLTRDNSIVGEPLRYEDWQEMVRQLVQHVSGTRKINDVYYEVWNEPDLFGKWHYGGAKNYLDLYGAAARGAAAARVSTNYKIGGPATTALYQNWIQALVDYTQANQYRLDFISWHRYTNDLDQYRQDASDVRQWLLNYPTVNSTLEYHITEWGHDSDVHSGYDNVYSAAHTAAASLDMIGTIERAFVFEIQDGKDPAGKEYWGRWGLFTHGSFGQKAKPRFRALQFLNQLGPQRVQLLGKGTYVKAVASVYDDGRYGIMLANFDPAGRNAENVPVSIASLPAGSYQVKVKYLNRPDQVLAPQAITALTLLEFTVPMAPQDIALATITAVAPLAQE